MEKKKTILYTLVLRKHTAELLLFKMCTSGTSLSSRYKHHYHQIQTHEKKSLKIKFILSEIIEIKTNSKNPFKATCMTNFGSYWKKKHKIFLTTLKFMKYCK